MRAGKEEVLPAVPWCEVGGGPTRFKTMLLYAIAASVPIPKFAMTRGRLRCELRNQRDTSKVMILVWFLDLKFLCELAAHS